MKTQYKRPRKLGQPGRALAGPCGAAFGPPVLDTYKQFAQPNAHAGFKRFQVSIQDDAGIPLGMIFEAIEGGMSPLEFLVARRARNAPG